MTIAHLRAVRTLPCVVCAKGGGASDPHHLRSHAYGRGMGKKSHDKWVVPLCRPCHNNVHLVGSKEEPQWFEEHGINAEELAKDLWAETPNRDRMIRILLRYL
jgi:hypothetical protein